MLLNASAPLFIQSVYFAVVDSLYKKKVNFIKIIQNHKTGNCPMEKRRENKETDTAATFNGRF